MRTPALTLSIGLLATIAATTPASASCSMGTLKGVYGYYHGRPGGGANDDSRPWPDCLRWNRRP
jgi:hypothetical protein